MQISEIIKWNNFQNNVPLDSFHVIVWAVELSANEFLCTVDLATFRLFLLIHLILQTNQQKNH